jgi:hypothetical protein
MYNVIIAPEKGNELITNDIAAYDTRINAADPTAALHGKFIIAFEFFNDHLFESRLPRCAITMRANHRSAGYFAQERFQKIDNEKIVDEIAMNPKAFKNNSIEDVLSTLVHEMVHLEQFHFGKPSRGKYHNREWGRLMKRIGLYPSHTGKPGGKETGQQMTHYIIAGGPFAIACAELLKRGFTIEYADIWKEREGRGPNKNKASYKCLGCGLLMWGKPGITDLPTHCSQIMVCVDSEKEAA